MTADSQNVKSTSKVNTMKFCPSRVSFSYWLLVVGDIHGMIVRSTMVESCIPLR